MLFGVFLLLLPALIFYTTGHRLVFEEDVASVVTTGGMYVTSDILEVDVYLDEVQVERPRLFRSAYYIQTIAAGQHRIVVQRPDLQTWVKELPVYPYIVTETAAFNMPVVPHVRPITEYVTATREPIFFNASTTERLLQKATTTEPFIVSSTTRPLLAGYGINQEYVYVASLFSTTTSENISVFDRLMDQVERFRFATTTTLAIESATSTEQIVLQGDMQLLDHDEEVYARWLGDVRSIPYYFCVSSSTAELIVTRYGEHVWAAIEEQQLSTSTPLIIDKNRVCRTEIKIDRLRQDVFYYTFFPNNTDLVLLHLEDGVYITEIDDRSWQNVQLLYPGNDIRVVAENGVIYVEDEGHYYEIITEIEPPQ